MRAVTLLLTLMLCGAAAAAVGKARPPAGLCASARCCSCLPAFSNTKIH